MRFPPQKLHDTFCLPPLCEFPTECTKSHRSHQTPYGTLMVPLAVPLMVTLESPPEFLLSPAALAPPCRKATLIGCLAPLKLRGHLKGSAAICDCFCLWCSQVASAQSLPSANAWRIHLQVCSVDISEKLEKAGTVDFKKHPARKVGTRSRQCGPRVPGRFAFPDARNPRIYSISRFGMIFQQFSRDFPAIFLGNPRADPRNSHSLLEFSEH